MKFLVATYGGRHIGMLLAHLQSIDKTHPGSGTEVYYQDLPETQRAAIMAAYPRVKWRETSFDFSGDRILRISSKTLSWEQAILQQQEGEEVALLDVDTLVIKDLRPIFSDQQADVIFTYKTGGFVLNTGVLLCRVNSRTCAFFRAWRQETLSILHDPKRYKQANDARLPYGASDQMALHLMLGYSENCQDYRINISGETVLLRGERCERLNETRSAPVSNEIFIIHYKGGWQPIILDGRRFTANRPKAASSEMYRLYLSTFCEGLTRVNALRDTKLRTSDFHIVVPQYVFTRGKATAGLLYYSHCFMALARELADLARRAIRLGFRLARKAAGAPV